GRRRGRGGRGRTMKTKLAKSIPYTRGQWSYSEGAIREQHGWMLGHTPFTLGDEHDMANGLLMAAAPGLYACVRRFAAAGDPGAQELLQRISDEFNTRYELRLPGTTTEGASR